MNNPKILKRINTEIEMAKKEYDIIVDPASTNDNHAYKIQAKLKGPEGSAFEGGVYDLEITIDCTKYPFKAPSVTFKSSIYHPNISGERICVDFLGGEWSPALTLSSVMKSLELLLLDPNPDSPLNSEAANDFRSNQAAYFTKNKLLISIVKGETPAN